MRRRHLYKYFSEIEWAERFLYGDVLFRSLAYFRDYEDAEVRGDKNEGTSIYRPSGGLTITNKTKGVSFTIPNSAFESSANPKDIFVFCLSRSMTDQLKEKFKSVACVEILDPGRFCSKIQAALPDNAQFPTGRGRHQRIGQRVEYYDDTGSPNPRWALPDKIALAKSLDYAWQDEFRLVFSLTNVFEFEKVNTRLVIQNPSRPRDPSGHQCCLVQAGSLHDICRLHKF
jgi:hypothetical protein